MLVAWIGVVFLLGVGCSAEHSPADCPDHVSLHVSSDSIPVFNWDPPCIADGFLVARLVGDGHDPVWDISSHNAISPPLVYGVSPLSEPDVVPPAMLIPGTRYRVLLLVFESYSITFVGQTEFTYQPATANPGTSSRARSSPAAPRAS